MDNFDFDKVINKAKDLASAAAEKTEELAKAGKARIEIKQTEYEVKKMFEKIGKACYESIINGVDNSADIDEMAKSVTELKNKIGELKLSLDDEEKSERTCPACGNAVSPECRFCPNCGEKI